MKKGKNSNSIVKVVTVTASVATILAVVGATVNYFIIEPKIREIDSLKNQIESQKNEIESFSESVRLLNSKILNLENSKKDVIPSIETKGDNNNYIVTQSDEAKIDLKIVKDETKKPSYDEPTEDDILAALTNFAVLNKTDSPKTVSVDFFGLGGQKIEIKNIKKLVCKAESKGNGYLCTYKITSKTSMYSNSIDGQEHANAWNDLVDKFLIEMTGSPFLTEIQTKRFYKCEGTWYFTEI